MPARRLRRRIARRPRRRTRAPRKKAIFARASRLPPKLGFPQRMTTNVLWTSDPLMFTSYGPTPDFAWFSMNSINACQIGPVPPVLNQPRWTDQYRTLYENYRVNSFKATINASTASAGSIINVYLIPTSSNTAVNHDFKNYTERGYPFFQISTNSKAFGKMSKSYNLHKVEAVKASEYKNQDVYSAPVNSNPLYQPFLTVSALSSDNVTTVQCFITVTLKYNVTFYDLRPIGPS